MGKLQGGLVGVRPDPDHQFLPHHPDRHVAGDEKGDAAEHLLLGHRRPGGMVRENLANAVGEPFVVGHGTHAA